ncbi:MAG: sulfite exporter TauE/SafE family protein [Lewinellaceae bacterium]|nr:sulfite exporter TauE/SafE family protein [Saprospiraceae bacterium]MCB9307997.1 sulfite exporter TauE/SafE family protein [Lewinellaceae bacterium]
MEFFIGLTAFLASMLTLFSGFGLGTILTPVFGLFVPIHIAVALTGVVHLLNNLFKVSLLGKHASRKYALAFGLPSVAGGLLGAWALARVSDLEPLYRWEWGATIHTVTWMKLLIAVLMIVFALAELAPFLKNYRFARKNLAAGGVLSGFFGGLSGHQGALRTAFLVNAGLSKEQFIATGIIVACMVDLTRLPVYFTRFAWQDIADEWRILALASICAFAGAFLGARFLKKTTLGFVRWLAACMILLISVLLGTGVI